MNDIKFPSNWNSLTDIQSLQYASILVQMCEQYNIVARGDEFHLSRQVAGLDGIKYTEKIVIQPMVPNEYVSGYIVNGREFYFPLDKHLVANICAKCRKLLQR